MARESIRSVRDIPAEIMLHRSVAVLDCVWQARLQREGSPLRDYVEYRLCCLLEPSAPVAGVSISRYNQLLRIIKEFRRQDILNQGPLIVGTLIFPAAATYPFLYLMPANEQSWEEMRQHPRDLWRTVAPCERPDATTISLRPGAPVLTGTAIEVATAPPGLNLSILLVDLENVKGLRAGRWRLRGADYLQGSIWQILATGARAESFVLSSR